MKLKYIDLTHIQIFNNITLMVCGYFYLNFNRNLTLLIPTFIISLILEVYLSHYFNKDSPQRSFADRATSISSTIASIYVLVNVDSPLFYLVAVTLGTVSKFVLRIKNEHIFNAANAGIVLALLFMNDSTVRAVYSQFNTPKSFIFWFIIANGLIFTVWTSRLVLAMSYLLGSALFLYLLSPLFGFTNTFLIGPSFSISGLLFIFFMISDPKSTPQKWNEQIIFGLVCALIGAMLRVNQMVHDGFVALFLTTGLYSVIRYDRLSVPVVRVNNKLTS